MGGSRATVRAAGCIVWRRIGAEPEVLVVHRPRWDDWSFPKGKLDPGERSLVAATREVEEETGLRVSLGPRLRDDHYPLATGQPKVVSYWIARPPKGGDITARPPDDEVDQVRWMPLSTARTSLTYPRDAELLQEFEVSAYDSSVLVVLRHTEARKRKTWKRDDNERPLAAAGRRAADDLVPVLASYGIRRVISSDAVRCVETVRPYVERYDVPLRLASALSEQGMSDGALRGIVGEALRSEKRTVICSHRPVLPHIFAALGIADEQLDPGGMVIVHRSAGRVLSVEKPD